MKTKARTTLAVTLFAAALIAGPAAAQPSPDDSQAQDLTNCAGAVAAVGDLDVVHYPQGAHGEWATLLGVILEHAAHEPGIEGMTGRYAASAARDFWREQSAAEREAFAAQCRTRYGS